MVNYPYESTFLAPLPAYPVESFCAYLNGSYEGIKLIDVSDHFQKRLTGFMNWSNVSFRPCKKHCQSIRITRAKPNAWKLILRTIRIWDRTVGTISRARKWWCRCVARTAIWKICSHRPIGISVKCRTNAFSNLKCDRINRLPPRSTVEIISSMRAPSCDIFIFFGWNFGHFIFSLQIRFEYRVLQRIVGPVERWRCIAFHERQNPNHHHIGRGPSLGSACSQSKWSRLSAASAKHGTASNQTLAIRQQFGFLFLLKSQTIPLMIHDNNFFLFHIRYTPLEIPSLNGTNGTNT